MTNTTVQTTAVAVNTLDRWGYVDYVLDEWVALNEAEWAARDRYYAGGRTAADYEAYLAAHDAAQVAYGVYRDARREVESIPVARPLVVSTATYAEPAF